MDVLTDVLQSFRLRSQVYGRFEMTAPWGFRLDVSHSPHPVLFVVSRGAAWLEVDGVDGSIPLAGGDFVLLPRGNAFNLRDKGDTPVVSMEEMLKACGKAPGQCETSPVLHFGGGGSAATLISGCLQFEEGGSSPIVDALPTLIHVKGDQGEPVQWLASTLQFLACEAASSMPGSEAIRSRLADILFVQAVRYHISSTGDHPAGWLRALNDPQIGKSLRLLHEKPADPWTVESLADGVAMSRSAFAEKFSSVVGEPPLSYLTRWRMQKAAKMLRQPDTTIATVARAVGYEAEASFGKAFKREMGMAPGEYRASTKVERHQISGPEMQAARI